MIEILGQVPSQKNSKNIGVNRHTGKTFVTSNKIVKAWQEEAEWQLRGKKKHDTPVVIDYLFYVKDHRRRDLDNMICTVNDALVKAGIIKDDDWKNLTIGSAIGFYAKEDPKVLLTIKPFRQTE